MSKFSKELDHVVTRFLLDCSLSQVQELINEVLRNGGKPSKLIVPMPRWTLMGLPVEFKKDAKEVYCVSAPTSEEPTNESA